MNDSSSIQESNEFDISHLTTLVSKTDLQGTILEANDAFVAASGYSREELIGQPHNIIRHPDVPKEVFADMWHTLQQGNPWVQTVKNRRKNGQFYWVESHVTPILQKNQIVGFLSVRRPISNEQKQQAALLYQQIRNRKRSLKNGVVMNFRERFCVFHRIHPINLMVSTIALLGVLMTLIQAQILTLPVPVAGLLAAALFLYALAGRKYAFNRLGKAKVLIDKMRQSDFTGNLPFYGNHSLSRLVAAVKMMQVQLGAEVEKSIADLNRSTRLKSALDSASAKVMMIDPKGSILYCNDELKAFFESNHAALVQSCPLFDMHNLIQQPLHAIFPLASFENLNEATTTQENIANLHIVFKIKPVLNNHQQRIGTVIEWNDITQEHKIESNLKATLAMAAQGHTALKIETRELSGFYLDTSQNINALLTEINQIIESMVLVMTRLATGDLKGRIDQDLQGALAAMKGSTNVSLDNLCTIVFYIKQAVDSVNTSVNESAKASHDLSERTQQAAATLQEINATMQEVHSQQTQNTHELIEISQLSEQTITENRRAKSSLDKTVTAIDEIRSTSEKIASIISLIDGISFQTNLLALNAAVEAARAGEHGRGFAVVAGEVRSLAQKSAEAAKEIKDLIDESVQKVHEGVEQVQQTDQAFETVNHSVVKIGEALKHIEHSIQDQQEAISNTASAIGHLDQNIQSNATLVEQTSAAAQSLKEQAELLARETNKFSIDERKTEQLVQNFSEIGGIRMNDLRQSMRIWRANAQSFLNGVNVPIEQDKLTDSARSDLGRALAQMQQHNPQIQYLKEFTRTQHLHQQQHQLVKNVLELMHGSSEDLEHLKDKDYLMDQLVVISDQLDESLRSLDLALFEQNSAGRVDDSPYLLAYG
ncbi:methyl-accepting chemotaxis protein [Thiomicrorhabdus sp. 6S3-12]|uniref:methyl-accepting chemotaxis protein n=1 Tax=Thiomicrorhabdus sp. 6S3-12 TaxID=2819681 RepID=UPI001AAC57BD|nr:methyl-accepting chemotaxis protein [Thiomicrorhabdus sp. 6S3-12]MBO1923575.1 PAS domain S-box protein [Thiomicrorhabdus sp. 6S3-12]